MDLHPDLLDLLGAFSASNVEYLVIGGWAVSVHTEPRFTQDLDVLIGHHLRRRWVAQLDRHVDAFGHPR